MPMTAEERAKVDEALTIVARHATELNKPAQREQENEKAQEVRETRRRVKALERLGKSDDVVSQLFMLRRRLAVLDPQATPPPPDDQEPNKTPVLYCPSDGRPFEAGKCPVCQTRKGINPFAGLKDGLKRLEPQLRRR